MGAARGVQIGALMAVVGSVKVASPEVRQVLDAATIDVPESSFLARARGSLKTLRRRAAGLPPPTLAEAEAFLADAKGRTDAAVVAYRRKQEWREKKGRITISQVGAFYLSEGYSVCLEGCTDLHGAPVIYANGMPHGSVDEVIAQTVYTYERAMVQAMKRKQELRCTTICNVLNPTFRFPDKAIKASLSVAKLYFPWHARGKTVFVGLPAPIRWTFKLCKPFMSREQYESISFANHNDLAALTRHISADNIPQELGGAAQWKMDEYVRRRASAEGVRAPRAPRPYRGKRLDVEQIRALEEVKG